MVEINPTNVDSMFINYNTDQKLHRSGEVQVDSTNYSKDIHTQAKVARDQAEATQTTEAKPAQQTPPPKTSATTTETKKPAAKPKTTPKKPEAPKAQKINISAGQKTVGEEEHGFFQTNLPVFESANITKPQPPYATTDGGVEIYIAGSSEDNPVTLRKNPTGRTEIIFKNSNIRAYIPPQENPKDSMIVYNPETQTMVFNNIEGTIIKSEVTNSTRMFNQDGTLIENSALDRAINNAKSGSNILINGGSVKEFNTTEFAENYYRLPQGRSRTEKIFVSQNSSQNIVLNNTRVEKFDTLNDMYITTGHTEILEANNHPEAIRLTNAKTISYHASDGTTKEGRAPGKSDGNGQNYFTLAQGVKWLNNGGDALHIDTDDTRGSIDVKNEVMQIKFENVPVSRTLNGVNIYIKGGDAKSIRNMGPCDGSNGFIDFNGTMVQFPRQPEGKNSNIYYDAETQTVVFENIDGLDVNYSETQDPESLLHGFGPAEGTHTSANIYIRNCYCKHLNTMETCAPTQKTALGFKFSENAEASRSRIMIDETSQVGELMTYRDDVYVHSGAEVSTFIGLETNTHGKNIEDINAMPSKNSILYGKLCAKKELLPEILKPKAYE